MVGALGGFLGEFFGGFGRRGSGPFVGSFISGFGFMGPPLSLRWYSWKGCFAELQQHLEWL